MIEKNKKKESEQLDYTQMRSDRSENTLIVYYENEYIKRNTYDIFILKII